MISDKQFQQALAQVIKQSNQRFNKMSSYVEPTTEIFIAEGPWRLEGHDGKYPKYDWVTHRCTWKKNFLWRRETVPSYLMSQNVPYCPRCSEPVPSMIQTLWTLKNMDHIQADATYSASPWPSSFYGQFIARPGQTWSYTPPKKI